jgi:hypothetical protein
VDARAKQLGLSRNRFIASTLEREIQGPDEWPAELMQKLERAAESAEIRDATEEMERAIRRNRRSRRRPPAL